MLSRYEYKTYDEIAKVLECSVGAVKVRVHRAMKQLREIYLEMSWRGIDMSCEDTTALIVDRLKGRSRRPTSNGSTRTWRPAPPAATRPRP